MRIAFITNEFVIEKPDAGGLASYLNRITRILHENGHEVEVFVTRHLQTTPRVIDFNGVRVQHVPVAKGKFFKVMQVLDSLIFHTPYGGLAYNVGIPVSLARALKERHAQQPFDFVQSTNLAATGLFVSRIKNIVHLVRLSSILKEYLINDEVYRGLGARLLVWMEKTSLRKADAVYSPSDYSARNYKGLGEKKISVIRPPFILEEEFADIRHYQLPQRYFIHFGSIGPLKGSDTLAEALTIVWKTIPDFKMVWAGRERKKGAMQEYIRLWGSFSGNVTWFEGLVKKDLYSAIRESEAAVLPSRVDNLPNSVIECLALKRPVIGTNGTSIDELVEHGISGSLVEPGNAASLAAEMILAWNEPQNWLKNGFTAPAVLQDFLPEHAAGNLLKLAKSVRK